MSDWGDPSTGILLLSRLASYILAFFAKMYNYLLRDTLDFTGTANTFSVLMLGISVSSRLPSGSPMNTTSEVNMDETRTN